MRLIREWRLVCHRRTPAVRARASPLNTEIKRSHLFLSPPPGWPSHSLGRCPPSDAIKKQQRIQKTSCIDTPTQVSSPRLHEVEYFCRPHVRPPLSSRPPASLFPSLLPRGSSSSQQQTAFSSGRGGRGTPSFGNGLCRDTLPPCVARQSSDCTFYCCLS